MKVKELNALLNKLAKNQQEQPIILAMGPITWENPTIVQGKDGFYLVPKEVEDHLEENMTREEIGQKLTEFHQANQAAGSAS